MVWVFALRHASYKEFLFRELNYSLIQLPRFTPCLLYLQRKLIGKFDRFSQQLISMQLLDLVRYLWLRAPHFGQENPSLEYPFENVQCFTFLLVNKATLLTCLNSSRWENRKQ